MLLGITEAALVHTRPPPAVPHVPQGPANALNPPLWPHAPPPPPHPHSHTPPSCREHLAGAQQRAEAEQAEAMERFRAWAAAAVPDAQWMNVSSGAQVLQLLFAGCPNKNKGKDGVPLERVFKVGVLGGGGGGRACVDGGGGQRTV